MTRPLTYTPDPGARLASPYGGICAPGGGWIENGRRGTCQRAVARDGIMVMFDREIAAVRVPDHWLAFDECR